MTAEYQSLFAGRIGEMLDMRDAVGLKRGWLESAMRGFDRHAAANHTGETLLSGEIATGWCADGNGETSMYRMRAIRAFGLYLQSVGVADAFVLPASWLKQPRPKLPHIFTDSELSAFFTAADRIGPAPRDPLRAHAVPTVFRLMLSCGLRPREARVLRRDEVDVENLALTVTASKGNKDRRVPFDEPTGSLLADYDAIARLVCPDRTWFFQSTTGQPRSAQWLAIQYHRCQALAGGVTPRSVPYTLRHNHATRILTGWLEDGRDLGNWLPYLSAYLGHSSYKQTAYYIHLLPERLAATGWTSIAAVAPKAVGL